LILLQRQQVREKEYINLRIIASMMTRSFKAKSEALHHLGSLNTRTWANAQRDGRPAGRKWRRPLFNAAKFG